MIGWLFLGWLLFLWLGLSLCAIAKTPAPRVDELAGRRARVRHVQAQIDRERARTGVDVVTHAAERFWSDAPHPKAIEAKEEQ